MTIDFEKIFDTQKGVYNKGWDFTASWAHADMITIVSTWWMMEATHDKRKDLQFFVCEFSRIFQLL